MFQDLRYGARMLLKNPGFTLIAGLLALITLLLAAMGLSGMLAYSVSRRAREIGVRMALGARPQDILRMVVRQGMTLALVGVTLGLIASAALSRLIKTLLFGVSANDPLTFVVITLWMIVVALLTCYFPAWRATKVDPLVALRRE